MSNKFKHYEQHYNLGKFTWVETKRAKKSELEIHATSVRMKYTTSTRSQTRKEKYRRF